MLENPEERKKRREQERQKRAAAQKKLVLRLVLAAGILLGCGILILTISLSAGKKDKTPPAEPAEVTEPGVSSPTTAQDTENKTVIHFAATGDLNVTQRVVASGGAEYDYTKTFMDVAPVLASADLAMVNLEGDLCGAPYGSNGTAPQTMAQALRSAGVDMIQLANSYAINRGISGLMTTIDSVKQAGMEPVGVFADDEQFESKRGFSLFQVQGVRVAVVAFTKGMDGTALVPGYENCVNILYTDYSTTYQKIDKDKIGQVMEAVQAQKPDITIALLHWGSELNDNISDSQESICQLLQSYGTDAIIGTHPHFVQEIDFDSENGTLVAYSLGDFIGDIPEAGTEYSIILDLEITKDHETGESTITNYSYTPIFTVAEENQPLRVLRIREAIAAYEEGYMDAVSEETYKAMQNALERIEDRIVGE